MNGKSWMRIGLAALFLLCYFGLMFVKVMRGENIDEMVKPLPELMGMVVMAVIVQYGYEKKSQEAKTPRSQEEKAETLKG